MDPGLAWILLGFAEQLEFLASLPDTEFEPFGGRATVEAMFLKVARATADFYIEQTPTDGSLTGTPALRDWPAWAMSSTGPPTLQ